MDDLFHDLVGPAVGPLDTRVDIGLRHRVLHYVAVPAVELHTRIYDLALQVGRPQFGLCGIDRVQRALVVLPDASASDSPNSSRA